MKSMEFNTNKMSISKFLNIEESGIGTLPKMRKAGTLKDKRINLKQIGFIGNPRDMKYVSNNPDEGFNSEFHYTNAGLITDIRNLGFSEVSPIVVLDTGCYNTMKKRLEQMEGIIREDKTFKNKEELIEAVTFFQAIFKNRKKAKSYKYFVIDGNTRFVALMVSWAKIESEHNHEDISNFYHYFPASKAETKRLLAGETKACDEENHDLFNGKMKFSVITSEMMETMASNAGNLEFYDLINVLAMFRDSNKDSWKTKYTQRYDVFFSRIMEAALLYHAEMRKKKISEDELNTYIMELFRGMYVTDKPDSDFVLRMKYLRLATGEQLNPHGAAIKVPGRSTMETALYDEFYNLAAKEHCFEAADQFRIFVYECSKRTYLHNTGIEPRFYSTEILGKLRYDDLMPLTKDNYNDVLAALRERSDKMVAKRRKDYTSSPAAVCSRNKKITEFAMKLKSSGKNINISEMVKYLTEWEKANGR